ncbi:MAG: hypothetical protein CMP14_06045 [Rickettsiales bacterium]|nr:hypothetical protein [Rickettsiales bacterium]|tara:strand:+ start:1466 stop:1861 length:396 start_codon:yes stop_codon:yes gene_type:complete
MRNALVILCASAGLALAGYAGGGVEANASEKPHIQVVFKKGSKVCAWTDGEGKKGTDYYYKDKTALSGSADRVIGNELKQGTWQITGAAMNLNWYGGKKGKGVWYKVSKTGKKSYKLSGAGGKGTYDIKCK